MCQNENDEETTSECISFVLRKSHTFITEDGYIYGQDAKFKTFKECMENKDIEPINIRDDYIDIIKVYNIENKTDIKNREKVKIL